jgi:hypothetical protein
MSRIARVVARFLWTHSAQLSLLFALTRNILACVREVVELFRVLF